MDKEDSGVPTITLDRDRFSAFVGRDLSVEEMAKWLPWLGTDTEEVGSDYVKIEYNPNRVDFCSYGGVARAFRGLMGWETGMPNFEVKQGNIVLTVDKSVTEVRPYVVSAVVRDLNVDYEAIRELMEMQEALHWMVGRDRKKASIGVHNLDAVKPPFSYVTCAPDEIRFVPLDKTEAMTPQEVLEKHEKGMAYKSEVDWASRYPLIVDRNGDVLSFPPIINGELTRVVEDTRNLFIDVTGTEMNAIQRSLNVLVTALADMGGTIESVPVEYSDRVLVTPDLNPQTLKLRVDYANEMLGLKLSESKAVETLQKSRLDAKRVEKGVLEVTIPAYRIDILHEIDLVEEVAIGYGYYNLTPTIPATVTTGKQHRVNKVANTVRQIMVGLGFVEVLNFILANEVDHYQKMRRKAENLVTLANPVSTEYSIIRNDLLPSLMRNLADNRHQVFPQQIFEVSDVITFNEESESRTEQRIHVAGASSHPTANFTEIKSVLEALLINLGLKKWTVKEAEHPSFLQGRAATVSFKGTELGVVGEIHPEVLNNFELENPTGAFEIDLQKIIDAAK
ncbi:MAG TPA: phenylalanine--tRNA ligase subunit beta [Candidatus Bathyarchaeota archaeon]|nr:phenylalanine--tRNA ligase subunit beta [Candidatus Bathyarchaeota archaeon]